MGGEVAYVHREAAQDRAAAGAHERFEEVVRRHHPRLRRAVAGIVGDPHRVDDVLQEAYLKAYRKLPSRFANEAHEAVWLARVVHRCALDELRRARRRDTPTSELGHLRAVPDDRGARLDVDAAFARLDLGDRIVLLLVDLLGFGYADAAAILRVPRGTVASRLHAARRRFRESLEGRGA